MFAARSRKDRTRVARKTRSTVDESEGEQRTVGSLQNQASTVKGQEPRNLARTSSLSNDYDVTTRH